MCLNFRLGPWIFYEGEMEPKLNPYSWNTNMSVVYLESPAGVGFSYSETPPKDKNYTDPDVAAENLESLLSWFDRFPEFRKNDFYVAGESYAGMYVPWISYYIYSYNNDEKVDESTKINLKGYAVGNGLTDLRYDWFGSFSVFTAQLNYATYRAWQASYSYEMIDLIDNGVPIQCTFV